MTKKWWKKDKNTRDLWKKRRCSLWVLLPLFHSPLTYLPTVPYITDALFIVLLYEVHCLSCQLLLHLYAQLVICFNSMSDTKKHKSSGGMTAARFYLWGESLIGLLLSPLWFFLWFYFIFRLRFIAREKFKIRSCMCCWSLERSLDPLIVWANPWVTATSAARHFAIRDVSPQSYRRICKNSMNSFLTVWWHQFLIHNLWRHWRWLMLVSCRIL